MHAEFSTIKSRILGTSSSENGPHETVKQFYLYVANKAKKLQMTPQETFNIFANGLNEDLRNHVLLQAPRDIATAFQYAETKNFNFRD